MKNEKKLHGYYSITQSIANFEDFRWNILLRANLLFMKLKNIQGMVHIFGL